MALSAKLEGTVKTDEKTGVSVDVDGNAIID